MIARNYEHEQKKELIQTLQNLLESFEYIKKHMSVIAEYVQRESEAVRKMNPNQIRLAAQEEKRGKYQDFLQFVKQTIQDFKVIESQLSRMVGNILNENNQSLRFAFSKKLNFTIECLCNMLEQEQINISVSNPLLLKKMKETIATISNAQTIIDFKENVGIDFEAPKENLKRRSIQQNHIERICFRGDTRCPELIFKTGFVSFAKSMGFRTMRADEIIKEPFESSMNVVAVSAEFLCAAFFPIKIKNPDKKNNDAHDYIYPKETWVYIVNVNRGFNVAAHGFTALCETELAENRFLMFPQEIATDHITPPNIIGAVKIKRSSLSLQEYEEMIEKKIAAGYDLSDLQTWFKDYYLNIGKFEILEFKSNPQCHLPKKEKEEIEQSFRKEIEQEPTGILPFPTDAYILNNQLILNMIKVEKECRLPQGSLMQISNTSLRNKVIQEISISAGRYQEIGHRLSTIFQIINKIHEIEAQPEGNETTTQIQNEKTPTHIKKKNSSHFFGFSPAPSSPPSLSELLPTFSTAPFIVKPSPYTFDFAPKNILLFTPNAEQFLFGFFLTAFKLNDDAYQKSFADKLIGLKKNFENELEGYKQLAQSYLDSIKNKKQFTEDSSKDEMFYKETQHKINILSSVITELDGVQELRSDVKVSPK